MWVAAGALSVNIALNFWVVPRYGIVGLAGATAATAWLNVASLYAVLQLRGWFTMTRTLASKIARQILATLVMAGVLAYLTPSLAPLWGGGTLERIGALTALVAAGGTTFFLSALVFGALDKDLLAQLRRRRPVARTEGPPNHSE